MPTLRSSVLIVQHPDPASVGFGADFARDFRSATAQIRAYAYPVVIFPSDTSGAGEDLVFLDQLNKIAPLSQRVVIQNDSSFELLRQSVNKGNVFKILPSFSDPLFERSVMEALEEYSLIRQNAKLLSLVNEQNESLKKLTAELEDRIEKRQKFLEDARTKLLATNHRVEALHRALVAVHRANSIPEMERLTNDALSGALGLSWIRILFKAQARLQLERHASMAALFRSPLLRGRDELGYIYFARESGSAFTKDETGFLSQVAEAVSLAIVRLAKLDQSETLKHQWESTFDAILEPVSLIDENHTVQRVNRAFAERSGTDPERIIGRKCFEVLFGRASPCENCRLNSNFRLKPAKTSGGSPVIYDVYSQDLRFNPQGKLLYVNMYHDVSAQLRLERQILESAKMAELGVIGSSIAHELNNPLGGMLSFLQLIRMDLKGDEPYYQDVMEMEQGALRCREIVKNLLGFTRKPALDDTRPVDLREIVSQALNITELQTRALGIQVHTQVPDQPVLVRGQFNFLAQAVQNFLQNAQEAILKQAKDPRGGRKGKISLRLEVIDDVNVLEIKDDGIGFEFDPLDASTSLGLTVALQIIRDHGGQLEFSSHPDEGTTARISFPRS
jgi:two-component system NtrC family sensor kinase